MTCGLWALSPYYDTGREGSAQTTLVLTANGILKIAPPQVIPADTVGAGDAFAGAFTVASASGMPLKEAIHFANAAGALATQGIGAQASIPVRDAILALVGR
jgi:ribokinase